MVEAAVQAGPGPVPTGPGRFAGNIGRGDGAHRWGWPEAQVDVWQALRRSVTGGWKPDGAHGIWAEARADFGGPGKPRMEILDCYRAHEYVWAVAHALDPADATAVAAWAEPLVAAYAGPGTTAAPHGVGRLAAAGPDGHRRGRAGTRVFGLA